MDAGECNGDGRKLVLSHGRTKAARALERGNFRARTRARKRIWLLQCKKPRAHGAQRQVMLRRAETAICGSLRSRSAARGCMPAPRKKSARI
eukprot:1428910-Pleurochrysis_carterae.AAC.2